jgi:hypothetical protein
MTKIEFAIAKFKYSKEDFYAVEIIERFKTYEQADAVFLQKSYADSGGGTWQEAYSYEIIDIKDDIIYYHNSGKIKTVLD